MKTFAALIGLISILSVAHADMGDSVDRQSILDNLGGYGAPVTRVKLRLVSSPAHCSNAGDETARPVYRVVNGNLVLAGFECAQDNRGGGN